MRTKIQKSPNLVKDILDSRNEIKNLNKVTSPKHIGNKGLTSVKSDKDLQKKLITKQEKNKGQVSITTSISEISQNDSKTNSKIIKDKDVRDQKDEGKLPHFPKVGVYLSPKNQGARFLKTKNAGNEKDDENTKKVTNEKEDRLQMLERKNEELQNKLDLLVKEKQKRQQILQQFKLQKEALESKLQKLKNVAAENRKLLKQRADGFNNSETEIQKLKDQIQRLNALKKPHSVCEFGINTETKQNQRILQYEQINPEKSYESNKEVDLSNEHKTQSTQQAAEYNNLLSCINMEDSLKLTVLKNLYQKFIAEKDQKLAQKDELIYQQQCELNQFYEHKFNSTSQIKLNIEIEQELLVQIYENQKLKNLLSQQSENQYKLMEEIRDKDREIQTLKREIKIKDIYYQTDIEITPNSKSCLKSDIQKIKKQAQELKSLNQLQQERIRELEMKNQSQEVIIKSLKDKKPKVIVK